MTTLGFKSHKATSYCLPQKSLVVFFFVMTKLRNVYLSREFLVHSQRHVKKSPQTMALIFQDKSWPLKLISHEHYGKSSARWAAFTRETSLKVEGVCVFELLLKGINLVFRVSIFRTTNKTWVCNNTMQYDKAEEASL